MAKRQTTKGPRFYSVTIEGACPLLMNANTEFIVPGAKKPGGKTALITDAPLEWRKKAYFAQDVGVYIPSEYIERCLQVAGGNWKLGKKVAATVFCRETRFPVAVKGVPAFSSLDDFEKHGWIDRRNVRMGSGSSVGRSRPKLPGGWKATIDIMATSPEVSGETLEEIFDHAGMYVGIGDWRPKFGRFNVIKFEEVV